MGLPSMTPVIGILDDCDRPEAAMLVVVFGHPAHPSVEYINPDVRPLALRGRLVNFPTRFTPLERFGMRALLEEDGMLQVTWRSADDCTAVYPDGQPRRWQGKGIDAIDVRPQLAGHVIKAVRAMRATSLAQQAAARQPQSQEP